MNALRALYLHDMRSQLPLAVAFSASLAILFCLHRISTGLWNYWDSEWAAAGLVASIIYLAPALLFFVSLWLSVSDRERGTLTWRFARPISSSALFGTRMLTVTTSWLLWISIAFLVHSPSAQAMAAFFDGPPGALSTPPVLWIAPGLAAIGLGTFAGELSRSMVRALTFSIGGLVALVGLVIAIARLLPTIPILLTWGQQRLVETAIIFAMWVSFTCLIASWVAVRAAPLGFLRIRHAWSAWSVLIIPGVVLSLFLLLSPLHAHQSVVHQLGLLGDGSRVKLCAAVGLDRWHVGIPVLVNADGIERELPIFTSGIFTNQRQGVMLLKALRHQGQDWRLMNRYGEILDWRSPAGSEKWRGVGWSPDGQNFAWTDEGFLHVMSAQTEIASHPIPFDDHPTRGEWIDNRNLLLRSCTHRSEGPSSWAVINRSGSIARAPEAFPSGRLFLFSLHSAERTNSDTDSDSALLAWQSVDRGPYTLLGATTPDWQFQPMTTSEYPLLTSVGAVGSGTLLWLEHTERYSGTMKIMRLKPGEDSAHELGQIEASPNRPQDLPRVSEFVDATGPWIVWAGQSYVVACNADTGRILEYELEADFWYDAVAVEGDKIYTPQETLSLPPES
ncbi:MAG: ABC transporter permease [bacterium]|nr:ABC transporter permease [bacterium]